MSYLQHSIDITDAFIEYWGINPTQISFMNAPIEGGTEGLDEWIRLSIIEGNANQASMGSATNLNRHNGIVLFNIFTVPDGGARRSLELLDSVVDFFKDIDISNTTFEVPDVSHIGIVDGWFQKNVVCNFYRDETY